MRKKNATFSELLQAFFIERLMKETGASSHTIESYRDTFSLLLKYSADKIKKQPGQLELTDLDACFISDFLDYLQKKRKMTTRSRNQRLSAIRSFYKYIAFKVPEHALLINRILSIPNKKHSKSLVAYLEKSEAEALLKTPNTNLWLGRRDHCLLAMAIQTGLRVSEITALTVDDLQLGSGASIRCDGKGRKERCTPLTKQVVKLLSEWMKENKSHYLFPSIHGKQLSVDSVQYLVSKYVKMAQKICPSLTRKKVSPHVLRHTAAMRLLQSGVDTSVISLWLGHENLQTTQIYLEANIEMKEKILNRVDYSKTQTVRFKGEDKLINFLKEL